MHSRRNGLYCSLCSRWQRQRMLEPGPSKEIGIRNIENTQLYSNYCLLGLDFNVRSALPLPLQEVGIYYNYLLQRIVTLPAAHQNFTSSTSKLYLQHIITLTAAHHNFSLIFP